MEGATLQFACTFLLLVVRSCDGVPRSSLLRVLGVCCSFFCGTPSQGKRKRVGDNNNCNPAKAASNNDQEESGSTCHQETSRLDKGRNERSNSLVPYVTTPALIPHYPLQILGCCSSWCRVPRTLLRVESWRVSCLAP